MFNGARDARQRFCHLQDKSGRKRLRLVDRPGFLTIRSRADADRASEGSSKRARRPVKPGRKGEYRADIFKVLKLPRELMRELPVESNWK
jgi:hypothetical protein